ncbi:serine-threonine protein kinase [Streptomyces sp. NPDC005281]|uniref:serine-threonine protein kinase n=1 Tax=Streptomyces sp. NPDC005281 TaxID=3155712 RepID=UPI0033A9EA84
MAILVGAGVYFGMSRQDNSDSGPALNTPTQIVQTPSAQAAGKVPQEYLGTWDSAIDNATGHHTRHLVIQQGGVGDTVLSLTADGPTKSGGTYHCGFTAELTSAPTGDGGPLHIGQSAVTVAEPVSACTPGGASTITLLSDGRLRRTGGGEQLMYTKAG